jgi:hypothetical protein
MPEGGVVPNIQPSLRLTRGGGLLAVAALALAGCATAPSKPIAKYVAPSAGPTAKLVMRGKVPAGDIYGVYVYDDAEKCLGGRIVGSGDSARNPPTSALAADRIATVEFLLVKPNRQVCSIQWSFTPAAGKTYLLNGVSVATACAARVMDMSDPDQIKPEPTALRRNGGGRQCMPLAQSRAASMAGADGTKSDDAVLRPSANAEDLKGLIGQ